MINTIYPRGSLISKKNDDRKYCIIKNNGDSYDCILYPFGISDYGSIIKIQYNEIDHIYFMGYIDEQKIKTYRKKVIQKILYEE